MNKIRLSNPVRLIAFFLTAILLTLSFGFTVDGWQIGNNSSQAITPDKNDPFLNSDGINNDNNADVPDNNAAIPAPPPVFYNRITGEECTEEKANMAHLAFVMNPDLPIYGISDADIICEFPVENNGTRWCVFVSETENLWKIGSVSPTKGYISNVIKYFSSVCVSNGTDDRKSYTSSDITGQHLDLSVGDYQYSEFVANIYTNRELVEKGLLDLCIDRNKLTPPSLPFDFTAIDSNEIHLQNTATEISINQGTSTESKIRYNSETEKYEIHRNHTAVVDKINNKLVDFKNCFILFADSVTYDNSEYSQMIMDTIGIGQGYYFTNGTYQEITWSGSVEGTLIFYTAEGQKLTVNRGESFISFVKASARNDLIIG